MGYKEDLLTLEELEKHLSYDPDTGLFTRKTTRGGHNIGDVAGSLHSGGYIIISINDVDYPAHRLAWFYCFEEWPEEFIDHIDRNKANNRLDNLREATRTENSMNMSLRKDNKTGYKGVSFDKVRNKFKAYITIKGKQTYLGLFKTAEEASEAYNKMAKEHFGEFYKDIAQ